MDLSGRNLIGFEFSGKGKTSFQAVDPSTQQNLETYFTEATKEEVSTAAEKAERAFETYRMKSSQERALFLEAIADEILNLGDILIKRCCAETALPEARVANERMRTVNQLRLFATVVREGSWVDARIDTALPDRTPIPRPDIRQMQIPLGPVGVFGASNFPLAFSVAGGDTASALAAGCPVIVKAHPLHPGTSELVGRAVMAAIKRSNMPEGTFSLIQGISTDVGMALVMHAAITAIGFTGSFKGGKAIFDAANSRPIPIPVFAEMGSVNPVFVLPGAMSERTDTIAQGMVDSLNLGVGQFCTNPGLVIANGSEEAQQFVTKVAERVSASGAGTMLSEGLKRNFLSGVNKLQGVNGVDLASIGQGDEEGNRVKTRVFSTDVDTFLNNKVLSEEVFGPATVHVRVKSKDELLRVASSMEGHLTATIHGTEKDLADYGELIRILERKVGRLIINGYPTGVEVCHAMVHGGPYPSTTAPQSTSVGTGAIRRFSRPVCYQGFPQAVLPDQLKNDNPLNIWRLVNGELTQRKL